jgi:hypothetical protein
MMGWGCDSGGTEGRFADCEEDSSGGLRHMGMFRTSALKEILWEGDAPAGFE